MCTLCPCQILAFEYIKSRAGTLSFGFYSTQRSKTEPAVAQGSMNISKASSQLQIRPLRILFLIWLGEDVQNVTLYSLYSKALLK